jgi:hypothetical protein
MPRLSLPQPFGEASALALSCFEHANCVFAMGKSKLTGKGIHHMSLRLAKNEVRYFKIKMKPVFQGSP